MGRLMKKLEDKNLTLQSLFRKHQHLISQQGDFVKFHLLTLKNFAIFCKNLVKYKIFNFTKKLFRRKFREI
jgi:hypothetical protein